MDSSTSIYLLSSERSGSNLLRQRLCGHAANLCSVPPIHLLRTLGYWEPLMGPFADEANWMRAIGYALRCCYERAVPWEHVFTPAQVAEAHATAHGEARTLVRLADTLYRLYAEQKGCTGYFCKDIRLYDFAHGIADQLPHARLLHLYRDPRDYALSQKRRPYGIQSVLTLAAMWRDETNASLRATGLPGMDARSFSLSYEDFVQREGELLEAVAGHFGLAPADGTAQGGDERSYAFHEWKNVHKPTLRSNFNKYKTRMRPGEVRMIEAVCWNTMRHLDYATEHDERPDIGPVDRLFYHPAACVLKAVRCRLNRFKLRNESINRRAAHALVEDLDRTFR